MTVAPYDPTETVVAGSHRLYGGAEFVAVSNIPTGIPPVPLGDGSTADRAIVLAGRTGYAAATVGGNAFATLTVTSTADSGAGTFRQAIADAKAAGGGYIIWAPGIYVHNFDAPTLGNCIIQVPSNTTINGHGADVTMQGFGYDDSGGHISGFYIGGPQSSDFTGYYASTPVHDVIVTGIKFDCNAGFADSHGDVVAVRYWARNIWLDHCFFRNFPNVLNDGLLDITHCASATVSWCDIYQHHKAVLTHSKPLVGSPTGNQLPPGVTSGSPGPYVIQNVGGVDYIQDRVTYVHNVFDSLQQRAPETDFDTTFAHVSTNWIRLTGGWNDGTNPSVNGSYNWPTTDGARYSETTKPGPGTLGPPFIAGPYKRNSGGASKSNGTNVSIVGSSILSEHNTYTNLPGDTNVAVSGAGGNWKTNGNTYTNYPTPTDHLPANVPVPPYTLALIPATAVTTSLRYGVGRQTPYWTFVGATPPPVGTDLLPTLIVEFGFNVGADTGSSWHIGDGNRGAIGFFTIAPDYPNGDGPFTNVTSYVQELELTSGSMSRVTNPQITYEAGTARVRLNNESRAFDPLNPASPFVNTGAGIITPLPIPRTIAGLAGANVSAFDAAVQTSGTGSAQAPAGNAAVGVTAFNATVTGGTNRIAPNGNYFGISHGNTITASLATAPDALIMRVFEDLPASFANSTSMKNVPAGVAVCVSFKPDLPTLADTTAAGYGSIAAKTGIIWKLYHTLSGLSDTAGIAHYAIIHHEPVGKGSPTITDGSYTMADWQNAQINFRNDVLDPLNSTRTHPIFFTVAHNGFNLTTIGTSAGGGNTYSAQWVDQWIPAKVRAVLDTFGLDCYGFQFHDQFRWGQRWADSHGMQYVVPELGYDATQTAVTTDAQQLSVMKTVWADYNELDGQGNLLYPIQPTWISWFNGNSSNIDSKPQSKAYWESLCKNQAIAPTT